MSLEFEITSAKREAEDAARRGDFGTAFDRLRKVARLEKRLAEANERQASKRPAPSDWLNDAFRRPARATWSR